MFYRKWSLTKNWSLEGKGITVHTGVPSGDPSLSSPVIVNLNLERIKQDLPKFRLQFTNAEQKWWEDFIREQSDRDGKRRGKRPRVKWILPTLREDEIDERPDDEAVERYAALQQLLSKEQKEVKVSKHCILPSHTLRSPNSPLYLLIRLSLLIVFFSRSQYGYWWRAFSIKTVHGWTPCRPSVRSNEVNVTLWENN